MPAVAARKGSRTRRSINEINMVPFIDVMLVLLIIFMATAPLMTPSVIQLPSIGKASKTPDQVIQVLIDENEKIKIYDGHDTINSRLNKVADHVRQMQKSALNKGADSAVVIAADKNIKYELVIKVMDHLQRSGIQRVGLSVQTLP